MAKEANNTATIEFPLAGVDLSGPFDMQAPGTTPAGTNVRSFEPLTQRARGGSRPGLERYLGALPTGSVIQLLDFIVDPQEDALTADTTEEPLAPFGVEYIDDPSSNNFSSRNPPGRRVRRGGSGYQSNRHKPAGTGTKRTPMLTWPPHGPVILPFDLTSGLLDATATDPVTSASVAGVFVYSPIAGTALVGGGNVLSVTFTPTDTSTYNSTSTTIVVSAFDPTDEFDGNGTGVCTAVAGDPAASFTSVQISVNGGPLVAYPDMANLTTDAPGGINIGDTASIIWFGAPLYRFQYLFSNS